MTKLLGCKLVGIGGGLAFFELRHLRASGGMTAGFNTVAQL